MCDFSPGKWCDGKRINSHLCPNVITLVQISSTPEAFQKIIFSILSCLVLTFSARDCIAHWGKMTQQMLLITWKECVTLPNPCALVYTLPACKPACQQNQLQPASYSISYKYFLWSQQHSLLTCQHMQTKCLLLGLEDAAVEDQNINQWFC